MDDTNYFILNTHLFNPYLGISRKRLNTRFDTYLRRLEMDTKGEIKAIEKYFDAQKVRITSERDAKIKRTFHKTGPTVRRIWDNAATTLKLLETRCRENVEAAHNRATQKRMEYVKEMKQS
jgi:hypothetical protein